MATTFVVGLGNTGSQYARTRHNIGLIAVKNLASKYNSSWKTKISCGGRVAQPSQNLIFFWPETFMNICGKNVKICMNKYKIEKSQLIVIHDCLETKLGKVKLQQSSSFKGHNGLKSICAELGGFKDFKRIAIGIGRPEERDQGTVATYVLSNFTN